MCKYCEESELIDNVSNCITGMFIDKNVFNKDGDFLLKIASDVDIGMGGHINIRTATKIDYCPFCGRELKD